MINEEFYAIDAAALQGSRVYQGLGSEDRALFRDLLDQVWIREGGCSAPASTEVLSAWVGAAPHRLQALLEQIVAEGRGALARWTHARGTGERRIEFAALRPSEDVLREQRAREQRRERAAERVNGIGLGVSRGVRAGSESPVVYLRPGSRSPAVYGGWLPTSRFATAGQALRVSQATRERLEAQYPESDVGACMEAMWRWLMDNPERRPSLLSMENFIERWLASDHAQVAQSKTCVEEVEAALRDMLDASRGSGLRAAATG